MEMIIEILLCLGGDTEYGLVLYTVNVASLSKKICMTNVFLNTSSTNGGTELRVGLSASKED